MSVLSFKTLTPQPITVATNKRSLRQLPLTVQVTFDIKIE